MFKRLFFVAFLLAFSTFPMSSFPAPKKKEGAPPEVKTPPKAGELKKYDDVIPKTAKSFPGVFTVHRVDDKVFFEIPQDGFHKLMLWQTEVVKGPAGVTWGGYSLGSQYLRWDRRGN